MPPYESSVIIGNFLSGGIVMNEFDFYTNNQLMLLFMGTCICVCGIFYKLCMLEKQATLDKDDPRAQFMAS